MGKNSIVSNSILNILKTVAAFIFPLVTYMYAARIFQSEGIGKIQFSQSFVTYFSLFGMLGVEKYGIREIAKNKENKLEMSHFAHELLMLNTISVMLAYALFFLAIRFVGKLQAYRTFLLINSLSIVLTEMGMDWLYRGVEDYLFITVRSCAVNGIAFVLLLLLVRKPEDIYIFVIIQTFSTYGANVLNLIHSRKYIIYKNLHNYSPFRHIRPVLVIFCLTLFTEVYTHIDVTMLGLLTGDRETGLYSAAHKISGMVTAVMTAAVMVVMPRITHYLKTGKKEELERLTINTANYLFMIAIPATIGLVFLSKQFLLIFSGPAFVDAVPTARILAFRVLFSSMNAFMIFHLFIPFGIEKTSVIATGAAALFNFTVNLILIGKFKQDGVAIATVLAEVLESTIAFYALRKIIPLRTIFGKLWQYAIAGIAVGLICYCLTHLLEGVFLTVLSCVACSAAAYFLVLLVLKNPYLQPITQRFRR